MIYKNIYHKLERLVPDLATVSSYRKLAAPGFMDLNVDVLDRNNDYLLLALSHYYRHPSGDMVPDPDMEVRVMPTSRIAEAMAYQDSVGYRRVYCDYDQATGQFLKVDLRAKTELNQFLDQWLSNLIQQGHKPVA